MFSLALNETISLENKTVLALSEDNKYFYLHLSLRLSMSFLSLIGSSLIIISYLLFKNLKRFIFRLIAHLALADLIFSLSFFMINENAQDKNQSFCEFQAFLLYASSLSSIFWTSIIAYSLYRIVLANSSKGVLKYENIFICIGYLVPLILSIIPFFFEKYGPQSLLTDKVNSWCGIKRDDLNNYTMNNDNSSIYNNFNEQKYIVDKSEVSFQNNDAQKRLFFSNVTEEFFYDHNALCIDFFIRVLPVSACFFINAIFYNKIRKIYNMVNSKPQLLVVVHDRIIWILILPIFCWSCEIILRILEYTNCIKYKNENQLYIHIIEMIDSIILPLYGAGNFFIYAWNPFVREQWKKRIYERNKEYEKENETEQNFQIGNIQNEEEGKKIKEERLLKNVF